MKTKAVPSTRVVRRALVAVPAAAVIAAGSAVLIGKAAGYGDLLSSFRQASPWWLMPAVPAELLAYVGFVLAFRRAAALAHGPSLPAGLAARLALASLGATRLVVIGGPGVLYWGLRRAGLTKTGAAARIGALNALLYGVFVAATAVAASTVLLDARAPATEAIASGWLLGVGVGLGAIVVATTVASASRRARRVILELRRVLATHDSWGAFLGAGLFWCGDVLCLWSGLRIFDVTVRLDELLLAYATAYIVTMLPVFLGGVGGPEAALALALHAFGAPLGAGLLGVLAYRLISFWLPTAPGLALLSILPRIGEQLGAIGANAAPRIHESGNDGARLRLPADADLREPPSCSRREEDS